MNKSTKSIITLAAVACLFGGSMGAAQAAEVVPVPAGFTITGSGFGHGVGMSQYGAQGMGLDGFSATEILTHYYPGTAVEPVTLTSPNIRVGILQDRIFVAVRGELIPGVSSGGSFKIFIDANPEIEIAAGVPTTFTTVNGLTEVTSGGAALGVGAKVILKWAKASTVIQVKSGTTAALATAALGATNCAPNACSNRYRYGTLEISSGFLDDNVIDLNVINTLRLSDEYLYGLGEVPSSWTEAAMQAQAIAGRSYAMKKTSTRRGCACQIYATTLDQTFLGFSKEIATSGNRWVAAVNATIVSPTTAYVVKYKGNIVSTYYSSSTGGKSQPSSEVWGSSFPYLVSVDDHWSQDPRVNNFNSAWTDTVDQASLIARLRAQGILMPDVMSITVAGNYTSGGISKLNLADSAGNITSLTIAPGQPVTPDELRGVLGTKSTYISAIKPGTKKVPGSPSAIAQNLVAITSVNWPAKKIKPTDFQFTGKVSPAQVGATVKLQQHSGSKWKTVSTATTNDKGAWSILWSGPLAGNHDLRITATNPKGTIKTATNRVVVAGAISISSPATAKLKSTFTVSGRISPQYAGVEVTVERKVGHGSWKRIGVVKTDTKGKWAISRSAGPNKLVVSYRAKTRDSRLGELVSRVKTTKVE